MIRDKLAQLVIESINDAIQIGEILIPRVPEVVLERPKEKAYGDWSTNVAMVLASQAKADPLKLAEIIASHLRQQRQFLKEIRVVPPGFINFFISDEWLQKALMEIEKQGPKFGYSDIGKGEKIQVEFVSANPTGPMHIGHGRWAAVGDALANVLAAAGYRVEREFYINDYGTQMDLFGASVSARYAQIFGVDEVVPEGGYHGAYVKEIGQEIVEKEGNKYLKLSRPERARLFRERAEKQVLEHFEKVLEAFGVHFDKWFSEEELHDSGVVAQAVEELRKKGHVYEKDGAVWLRTTTFGDDKDRVLIRENGEPTYFAADVAYHKNKLERGFKKIINVWGADHHGYVGRVKAAVQALGYPADQVEIIIGQLVNLYRRGEQVRMSKRTGEMVTFEELLEEVGRDVARYIFLTRSTDSPLDFDIELAKEQSQENPVYYVQYAHARISSILEFAREKGVPIPAPGEADTFLLKHESELELIRKLLEFQEMVEDCARFRAPFKLTRYAEDLAALFHVFYTQCRVVTENKELSQARLSLVKATKIVLKNVLGLLGVSAPEKM
ncbi:MAG: arginine--tRNA ligase [Actinomycetota bacterium]